MSQGAGGEWLLAVDTALREHAGLVAADPDGRLLEAWEGSDRVDRELIAALRRMLGTRGGELLAVVAGRGPGSYTGLRVGAAAALGVARARGCPLLTVPSLLVTAATARPGPSALLVVHPAGRGAHHAQAFRAGDGGWLPSEPARLVARDQPPAAAGGALLVVRGGELADDWRRFADARAAPVGLPRAQALARVAARTWADGDGAGEGALGIALDYGAAGPQPPWS